jgi:hypothetical protein
MSNEFGYIPESPEQSFGNNKGIFTPTDIYDLTRADKYTQYGQLEHIQTQTVSSATADFTALQENTYNVHLFTFTDIHFGIQTELGYKLSNDSATSYESGYGFANQRGISNGSFAERKSTSQNSARLFGDIDAAAHSLANGYMYLYNAGDSTKYTFSTSHMVFVDNTDAPAFEFGSQLYDHAEAIQAIRFGQGTTTSAMTSATISLYGIKEYS